MTTTYWIHFSLKTQVTECEDTEQRSSKIFEQILKRMYNNLV